MMTQGGIHVQYHIKRLIFVLLSLLAILHLLYWVVYDAGELWEPVRDFLDGLVISPLFLNSEARVEPLVSSVIAFPLAIIVFLIFYRKECKLGWPLVSLFAGVLHSPLAFFIADKRDKAIAWQQGSPLPWEILLGIFLLCALAAIIGLIIAIVKYPKSPHKIASASAT